MTGKGSWPWMAAGLAVILLAMGLLRDPMAHPEPDPTPAPRVATLAVPAQAAPPIVPPPTQDRAQTAETPEGAESTEGSEPASEPTEPAANPFAVFLAPPDALTEGHDRFPPMDSLEASDEDYSAKVEAKQLFAPFEDALIAAEPLSPGVYKALLEEFKDRNLKVLKRAEWLRKSGHPGASGELIREWGRLFDHYKAQAYGRGQIPVPED